MTKIKKAYGLNNPSVFPVPIKAKRAPDSKDFRYIEIGQVWIDELTSKIYCLSRLEGGSATWQLMSNIEPVVQTLEGDVGGELNPTAGNMTLKGGNNITSTGTDSTIQFDLDSEVTVFTSIESPSFSTESTAAGATLSGNTLSSDGTNADINLNLIPKGIGQVAVSGPGLSINQLRVHGGSVSQFIGTIVLDAGTKTIANIYINNTDKIFITRAGRGLSTKLGTLNTKITGATSFEIESLQPATPTSLETGDLSIVDYFIVRMI